MCVQKQNIRHYLGQTVTVRIDRPMGYDHHGIVYPVNYGYLPGTMAADGEPQDAYILGVQEPLAEFTGTVIAIAERQNDCEDKLIVVPQGHLLHQAQIAEAIHFQEQYFDTYIHALFQKSCGVLPYRNTPNGQEYLIVYQQGSQSWSLPKGRMEPFETEQETALRELQEETGLTARLDSIPPVRVQYPIFTIGQKEVLFFAARVTGHPVPRPGEIAHCQWVKAEALSHYLHPDTANICNNLISKLTVRQ